MMRLIQQLNVASASVSAALMACDRAHYCPPGAAPYMDAPLSIGHGVTISAPHMHAMCLEILRPYVEAPNCRVLDVGSGSGYLTAALAVMGHPFGATVYGVECVEALVDTAAANILRDGKGTLLQSGRVVLTVGDGSLGLPSASPFQAIHVGAAAATMPPALVAQLAAPGRMVIPIGPANQMQSLVVVTKDADGKVSSYEHCKQRVIGQVKLWAGNKGFAIVVQSESLREFVLLPQDMTCARPRRIVQSGDVVEFEEGVDREGTSRAFRATAPGGGPLQGEEYCGRPK